MKPISLRFKAFGPFVEEQTIDFNELTGYDFFLIYGDTGAGKTTILEAITYSLFGKSSGGSRGNIGAMRCDKAAKNQPTEIEFVFESDGEQYRFHREITFGKTKYSMSQGCEKLVDGVWTPCLQNTAATYVDAEAERILGVTYDQFCQLCILPQGKFETFLTSDSKAKEEILKSIFKTEKWDKITDYIFDKVEAEKKRLDDELKAINAALNNESCSNIDELLAKKDEVQKNLNQLTLNEQKLKVAKDKATKEYEEAIEKNKDFLALEKAQKNHDDLVKMQDTVAAKKAELQRISKADSIRVVYSEYQNSVTVRNTNEATYMQSLTAHTDAEKISKQVIEAKANYDSKRPEYEKAIANKASLEGARANYASINQKKGIYDNANSALISINKTYEVASKASGDAKKAWSDAYDTQRKLSDEYNNLVDIYRDGIAVELADKIRKDPAGGCPVCGNMNIVVSKLATPKDGVRHVTSEEVDVANKRQLDAGAVVTERQAILNKKEAELKDVEAKRNEANSNFVRAKADYEASLNNLIDGIADEKTLLETINRVSASIVKYQEYGKTILAKVSDSEKNLAAATKSMEEAGARFRDSHKEMEAKEIIFNKALTDNGFSDVNEFTTFLKDGSYTEQLRAYISDYDGKLKASVIALNEAMEAVKDKEKPDMAGLMKAKDEAETLWSNSQSELSREKILFERITKLCDDMNVRWAKYNTDRSKSDANLKFASAFDPDSGTSLQRYVLGVMLSSVIGQANQLLELAFNGRYKLTRSNESTGGKRKKGLELNVYDTDSMEGDVPVQRSVKTLSGGERFIVSMCLAIGLATIVSNQNGGLTLDSMFIDEGFGTLDEECLNAALAILHSIKNKHSLVGVISHVEKLRENAPARIEAIKNGSDHVIKIVK